MVTKSPEEEMVEKVLDLLKDLLEQDEKYLITNQSMHVVITLYETELLTAIRNGSGASLIDTWKREVPQFRQAWLNSPMAGSTMFQGGLIKTVTESATFDAKSDCEKRKRGTRGGPGGSGRGGPRSTPPTPRRRGGVRAL